MFSLIEQLSFIQKIKRYETHLKDKILLDSVVKHLKKSGGAYVEWQMSNDDAWPIKHVWYKYRGVCIAVSDGVLVELQEVYLQRPYGYQKLLDNRDFRMPIDDTHRIRATLTDLKRTLNNQ